MTTRKAPPDINQLRSHKLHYDLLQKSKPQSDEVILKGNYGQNIPLDRRTGNYRFQSPIHGAFDLFVSRSASDWPYFSTQSELDRYGLNWCKYAVLWLKSRGYWPINLRLVDHYVKPGQLPMSDQQAQLRAQITAGFLSQGKINRSYFEGSADVLGAKS